MLAETLNTISSHFTGTKQEFNGPSASFLFFVRERTTEMAINGYKGMAFSMNDSQWSLDVVKSSLDYIKKDGFDAKIVAKNHQLENGDEGIEFLVTIEWK